jgi:flagellar hook protein FlgE
MARPQVVGQVMLATFRNRKACSRWATTSGRRPRGRRLHRWRAGFLGQYGVLQSAALEESNVDLTAELVNMITMQRSYQANAQTIKTQDSILQTLVNLR